VSVNATNYSNDADPSGTYHLRERKYRPDLTGRVDRLAAAVNETLGENDVLGAADAEPLTTDMQAALAEGYEVPETLDTAGGLAATREAFNEWFRRQVRNGVLEPLDDAQVAAGRHYTAKYVRAAERKGESFARAELERAGVGIAAGDDTLSRPRRAQLLARLYGRNYGKLETLTEDMAADVRDELTFGLIRGENPRTVGRTISRRVRTLGRWRGELIARTETLRAHNETALDVYDEWFSADRSLGYGIEGSNSRPSNAGTGAGKAMEHTTAGDSRVCSQCRALEGQTYPIRQVKNNRSELLPPVHPQCRCVLVVVTT
jgi:hypothetical protein